MRLDLNATLKSAARGATGDRGHRRFRNALVVGQFALAMVLLAGAALFVRGLDEGLLNMKPDGRRRIRVPAALAYGEKGIENVIPPNSDLMFEVHMIEVHPAAQAKQ